MFCKGSYLRASFRRHHKATVGGEGDTKRQTRCKNVGTTRALGGREPLLLLVPMVPRSPAYLFLLREADPNG